MSTTFDVNSYLSNITGQRDLIQNQINSIQAQIDNLDNIYNTNLKAYQDLYDQTHTPRNYNGIIAGYSVSPQDQAQLDQYAQAYSSVQAPRQALVEQITPLKAQLPLLQSQVESTQQQVNIVNAQNANTARTGLSDNTIPITTTQTAPPQARQDTTSSTPSSLSLPKISVIGVVIFGGILLFASPKASKRK